MPRSSLIIIILIVILMISSYWFSRNRDVPPWMKCKESLFEQVVFKKCTPSSFNRPNSLNQEKEIEEFPVEQPLN